jgi:hypothetical protein
MNGRCLPPHALGDIDFAATIARHAMIQTAQAEAILRSGRALLFERVSDAWTEVIAGRCFSLRQHALLRVVAAHATVCAAQAVDLMHEVGGGSSVPTSSRLELPSATSTSSRTTWPYHLPSTSRLAETLLGRGPASPVF